MTTYDGRPVGRVYSGKPGCCCGCLGKYYSPSDRVTNANAGEINDRQVTRIVNLIKKNRDIADDAGDFVSIDTPTRTYIAYFRGKP